MKGKIVAKIFSHSDLILGIGVGFLAGLFIGAILYG